MTQKHIENENEKIVEEFCTKFSSINHKLNVFSGHEGDVSNAVQWLTQALATKDTTTQRLVEEARSDTAQRYLREFAGLDPSERHDKAIRELKALQEDYKTDKQ